MEATVLTGSHSQLACWVRTWFSKVTVMCRQWTVGNRDWAGSWVAEMSTWHQLQMWWLKKKSFLNPHPPKKVNKPPIIVFQGKKGVKNWGKVWKKNARHLKNSPSPQKSHFCMHHVSNYYANVFLWFCSTVNANGTHHSF